MPRCKAESNSLIQWFSLQSTLVVKWGNHSSEEKMSTRWMEMEAIEIASLLSSLKRHTNCFNIDVIWWYAGGAYLKNFITDNKQTCVPDLPLINGAPSCTPASNIDCGKFKGFSSAL